MHVGKEEVTLLPRLPHRFISVSKDLLVKGYCLAMEACY